MEQPDSVYLLAVRLAPFVKGEALGIALYEYQTLLSFAGTGRQTEIRRDFFRHTVAQQRHIPRRTFVLLLLLVLVLGCGLAVPYLAPRGQVLSLGTLCVGLPLLLWQLLSLGRYDCSAEQRLSGRLAMRRSLLRYVVFAMLFYLFALRIGPRLFARDLLLLHSILLWLLALWQVAAAIALTVSAVHLFTRSPYAICSFSLRLSAIGLCAGLRLLLLLEDAPPFSPLAYLVPAALGLILSLLLARRLDRAKNPL